MSDFLNNEQREQLLTAYFDNELGPEERMQVESFLANNPDEAQILQTWRENATAIRELPRFSLDDGFAARVMAATNISADHADPSADSDTARNDADAATESASWRIGIGAIASLAAMLLLTLFVFPSMMDSHVAVNQPETTTPDPVANVASATNDVKPETPDVAAKRQPTIGPLNSSLPGGPRNGRPVNPIVLSKLTGPHIEQVLWVENKSLADLETALTNHLIKIVDSAGGIQNQAHLVPQSTDGVEALVVVSTADRMKQAIAEMSNESKCNVRAFPLPPEAIDNAAPLTEKAKTEIGSVQQIKPLDLRQTGTDASEIASLDKWFGLVDEADESRMIRFLLLLSTPSESEADASPDSSPSAASIRQ